MSIRRKGNKPTTHKFVKNIVSNDEQKALKQVCEKTNLQPKAFKTAHTDKLFVFVEK
ncbi:hypothetical protein [Aurantibacter aestuarii]|uniref:hypothetical protein n=1 Tax=Aurantibacter aestuarii TaxID=1266046 RepID=UPI0015E64864|nr:hypothetical protein [Aurantibacter aestuarii]